MAAETDRVAGYRKFGIDHRVAAGIDRIIAI